MDIYSYSNSKDVEKHLRKIKYQFDPIQIRASNDTFFIHYLVLTIVDNNIRICYIISGISHYPTEAIYVRTSKRI